MLKSIDCWFELRSIRSALETDYAEIPLTIEQEPSAQSQLMDSINDWEKEMQEDEAMYKIMIKGEIDTAVVSYYLLDEETRQAVLH